MSSFHLARRRVASLRLGAAAFAIAVALSPFAASAHEFKVGSIEIAHPWSRATPPGATTGAGYLKLTNEGQTADRLVSAASPAAKDVQIHEMRVDNGVMTMRQLPDGLSVPAGETVALEPSSYHLMLMGLAQPLKEGEHIPVTLRFEKAGSVDVWLMVDKMGGAAPAHDHAAGGTMSGNAPMDHSTMDHGK